MVEKYCRSRTKRRQIWGISRRQSHKTRLCRQILKYNQEINISTEQTKAPDIVFCPTEDCKACAEELNASHQSKRKEEMESIISPCFLSVVQILFLIVRIVIREQIWSTNTKHQQTKDCYEWNYWKDQITEMCLDWVTQFQANLELVFLINAWLNITSESWDNDRNEYEDHDCLLIETARLPSLY